MLTRVFKSGNSLAVRIPKELAIVEASQEVEIERVGQSLVIRPVVHETLADLPAIFASFSDGMRGWRREPNEQKERDWSGWWDAAQPPRATELVVNDSMADKPYGLAAPAGTGDGPSAHRSPNPAESVPAAPAAAQPEPTTARRRRAGSRTGGR